MDTVYINTSNPETKKIIDFYKKEKEISKKKAIKELRSAKKTEAINKVIFLDIDGVLNVIPQGHDKYGGKFHKIFEENLKTLIDETGAKIVISSTWRASGLEVMQEMWKHRNLSGEVIDITPFDKYQKRGLDIRDWIDKNPVSRFVIIDDDEDFLKSQKKFFVKTSGNIDHEDCIDIGYGLTKECTKQAIHILNK